MRSLRHRRAVFCDGHPRERRTVAGSSAGPTEPERAYGASASERRLMVRSAVEGAWHSGGDRRVAHDFRGGAPDRDHRAPGGWTRRRPRHRPPSATVIGRRTDVVRRASSTSSELRRYGRAAEGSPAGLISVRSAHRKSSVPRRSPSECHALLRRADQSHERRSNATRRSQRSGSVGPAGDPSAARISRRSPSQDRPGNGCTPVEN